MFTARPSVQTTDFIDQTEMYVNAWEPWWEIQSRALTTWFYRRYPDMQRGNCPLYLFSQWIANHEKVDFPGFLALASIGWDGASRALTGL